MTGSAPIPGRARVVLTPRGDRIEYRVLGRLYCTRMDNEIRSGGGYGRDDLVWRQVFGSEGAVDAFLKRNRRITRVVSLHDLGYDICDQLR